MEDFPKRIIYVDDEPQARRLVKDVIGGDEGSENFVITCATGRELIARIKELDPDLILLDLRMPDMNGPDTIEELRRTEGFKNPPFIFVTERKKVQMIDNYKALGVIGVIHKPLDAKTLKGQIKKCWLEAKSV